MKLSADEFQKLCGNPKESSETLQMSASKEAISLEPLQQRANVQKEKIKGNKHQGVYARKFEKLQAELQKICDGILALMDENLVPSEISGESKVFYATATDTLQDLPLAMPEARSPTTPVKRMPKPQKIAEKDLVVTSGVHLDTEFLCVPV